jgi:hypothetical protein
LEKNLRVRKNKEMQSKGETQEKLPVQDEIDEKLSTIQEKISDSKHTEFRCLKIRKTSMDPKHLNNYLERVIATIEAFQCADILHAVNILKIDAINSRAKRVENKK